MGNRNSTPHERRRVADEFLLATSTYGMLAKVAADESLPAKSRVSAEFGMAEFKKEVERLGERLLQLDASVSAARAR